jgi:hypothetical protein
MKAVEDHSLAQAPPSIQQARVSKRSLTPRVPTHNRREVKAVAGIHRRAGSRDAARRSRQDLLPPQDGQLRSIKIGKLRRITEQQLAEFIASLGDAA